MDQITKDKISKTRNTTRERRNKLIRKVFELKIDISHLNKQQLESLKMLFIEAKWLYNHWLCENDIFNADYKQKKVTIKNINGEFEQKNLKFLPTRCKQSILHSIKQSIYILSKSKKYGHHIGRLKFKKNFSALIFNQYGHRGTHEIRGNKIKILGIKKLLPINGTNQLIDVVECGEARLIKKSSGFYVHLTTYSKSAKQNNERLESVGLDFGIKETVTTSDGEIFDNCSVQEPEHLKKLQQKLSRSQKGSKNRHKIKLQIQKEYEKMSNRKEDISNKIVHQLVSTYKTIYIQDDNFRGWHRLYSKRVQHNCLGRIKEKLKQKNAVVINRFLPSTQLCYVCKHRVNISLGDRIFKCPVCNLVEHRDTKAAKTIKMFGNGSLQLPTEHRDIKPVEMVTSTLKENNFKARTVDETGRRSQKR
jgi:putative transposase